MSDCKGIYFRGERSTWWNDRGIGETVRLNFLKRKSCSGCDRCGFLKDDFVEMAACNNQSPLIGMDKVESGKIYTLIVTNISRDWESGVVDDYDIEIVEVEEPKTRHSQGLIQ